MEVERRNRVETEIVQKKRGKEDEGTEEETVQKQHKRKDNRRREGKQYGRVNKEPKEQRREERKDKWKGGNKWKQRRSSGLICM